MTNVTPIYLTSWKRPEFTKECIRLLNERTEPGTFKIHVLENEATRETSGYLLDMMEQGLVESVLFHRDNTRCLWGKAVFQAMTESRCEYYVVTDNDIYPPKLSPDWLSQMVGIMDRYKEVALLSPYIAPIGLMGGFALNEEIIYCRAVGNALKMVRRSAYPEGRYAQDMNKFGDDGMVSTLVREAGNQAAFCRRIYCWHAGQTENWGYTEEEIKSDPRKDGYGKPYSYEPVNKETYEPPDNMKV